VKYVSIRSLSRLHSNSAGGYSKRLTLRGCVWDNFAGEMFMPYVVTSDCTMCGACAAGCDTRAIIEGREQMTIELSICIECGLCVDSCPFQAIVFEEEPQIQSL
jgi:ferredoxin